MQQPSKRNRQVADLLHREIALLLKHEVNDPRLAHVLITEVDLSPDLSNARIYFTVPDEVDVKTVESALKKASGFIRRQLSARIELRYTPQIRFAYDTSIKNAERLMSLMDRFEKKTDD